MKALLEFLAERGTLVDAAAAKRLQDAGAGLAHVEAALRAAPVLPLFLTEDELAKLVRARPVVSDTSAGASPSTPAPAAAASSIAGAPPHTGALSSASGAALPRTATPGTSPPAPPAVAGPPAAARAAPVSLAEPPRKPPVRGPPAARPGPQAASSARDPFPSPTAADAHSAAASPRHLAPAPPPAPPAPPAGPAAPGVGQASAPTPSRAAALAPPTSRAPAPPVARVEVSPAPRSVAPVALEPYAHEWNVLADITGQSTCEGDITDFTRYFNDRLSKIKKMLRQRREMVGHVPIKSIRPGAMAEVKVVGIVSEVRTTKNGHRLFELEDESGVCAVLAPASDPHRLTEAESVIEDEVVGVIAKPASKGDLLILERVVRPEVPMQRDPNRSSRRSAVAFVSDLHFGSKTFLHDDWERFIRWINLEHPDARSRALARKVKYVVVNGDAVDGVGMFPGQEDELAILDAYEQYETCGREIARIRPDIKVFVLPGNHDLVRPAEPQPSFPQKYTRYFPERVTFLGNPCKLSIEGVEILGYHGRSFDDWITRVAGLSYERPLDAMREMVARRHMVPIYGARTPIAPEHKDHLVIDTVPDVFVTGHVHAAGMEQWRGITLINASCWQSQTAYQKMHGFMPVPGRVPVVELDTGEGHMLDFHEGSAGIDRVGRSALGRPDPNVVPEF